mgnify:CR=1 FL=1
MNDLVPILAGSHGRFLGVLMIPLHIPMQLQRLTVLVESQCPVVQVFLVSS